MRIRYELELSEIERDVVAMGSQAGEMVRLAVRAAIDRDSVLAAQVVQMDDDLDRRELSATEHVVTMILREAPVGRDLLFLTCMLGIFSEIEKVGDDATKLARRVGKLRSEFPSELRRALSDIDKQARGNLATAIRLCCEYDPEQAAALVAADDEVDFAYKESRDALLDMIRADTTNLRQLLRSADVFRAIEHVSDRAVEIAKRLKRFHERFPGHRQSPANENPPSPESES
jgi:phosphate transport system protein